MKPLVVLLASALLGAGNLKAISIDSIGGDTNSLHGEWSFPFNEGFSLTGEWEGGTYILGGFVQVVYSGFQLEMYQDIFLRTFWADGWVPNALGNHIVGTNPSHNWLPSIDPTVVQEDFGPNHLEYTMNASAFIDLTLVPETRSGHGTISYDIARHTVPDGGSTLAMLGLSLVGILMFRRQIA